MKKLCALAVSLFIGAASFGAQAGDRHRGHHHHDHHRHYERHCDDWRGHDRHRHPHVTYREYRPVHYHPGYREVRYYSPAPIYRERVRYRDNDIHGSIHIGF